MDPLCANKDFFTKVGIGSDEAQAPVICQNSINPRQESSNWDPKNLGVVGKCFRGIYKCLALI